MAAVRRSHGFIRYALSVQYHGPSFLGFSYQGPNGEDCILPNGTDLRGFQSVEGRLRQALSSLVGDSNYENIQVSSRTDRGVHALNNTLHVDIRSKRSDQVWDTSNIVNGLNFHLVRQDSQKSRKRTRGQAQLHEDLPRRHSSPYEMRVSKAAQAPLTMKNTFHTGNDDQPPVIDWNARFSATQRTYIYRILHQPSSSIPLGIPFEWDRSWLVRDSIFDITAMKEAALYLSGTHDFTSFRGNNCQRASPIVTLQNIAVDCRPYDSLLMLPFMEDTPLASQSSLVTIGIVGDSFLYRQVRNIVGCLVQVGRGKMQAGAVRDILEQRNRKIAPAMAPAHGLFLVDVQHGDFSF